MNTVENEILVKKKAVQREGGFVRKRSHRELVTILILLSCPFVTFFAARFSDQKLGGTHWG